jgi:hypothetical protein
VPTAMPNESVALIVAWKSGNGYQFGKVVTSARFSRRLRTVTTAIDAYVAALESKVYSVGDEMESDEYMLAPLVTPRVPAIVENALVRTRAGLPTATTDNPTEFRRRLVSTMGLADPVGLAALRQKTIVFYAIVRGNTNADRIAYVRHLNPMRLTKPGNILAMLGDTLDTLSSPVFAMDDRADLIIKPTEIAVLNKTFFDSLFFGMSGDGAQMDGIVRDALQTLPFKAETLTMLIALSRGKKRSRRKMLEIQQSDHLAAVTLDKFKEAVVQEGYEEAKFVTPEGQIFASDEDGHTLLEILNEDIYNGLLTGRRLSATRKRTRS